MANLERMLSAAKKQQSAPQTKKDKGINKQNILETRITPNNIDSIDNLIFGQLNEDKDLNYIINPNTQQKIYDPEEEMKMIKNEQFNKCNATKIPKAILESIMENPLNLEPLSDNYDNLMTEATQKRTQDIIDKLEKRENQQTQNINSTQTQNINETYKNTSTTVSNIDIQSLAQLIESIIDKKFKQYNKTLINEGLIHNNNQLSLFTVGDNFKFMDDTGNVYECTMKYIGKGKVKNK
jgi:hypothetical protein